MKKTITTSTMVLLLTLASHAYAGGADTPSGLDNHWYVGVLGGAAINIANSEAFYNAGATSASFDTTAYDVSGITGAEIGCLFNIPYNNKIGVAANVNYDVNTNIEEIWHIDSNVGPNDPLDLKNSITPRWQYNLLLNLMHELNNSFTIGIDVGFSLLEATSYLNVTDAGDTTQGNQAAQGNHAKINYLPGGVLGLKSSFLISKNSSLDLVLNEYIYAEEELSNINPIDTESNDKLSNRKYYLSIPILAVQYSYHF